jgi:predicted N-acyltransferase
MHFFVDGKFRRAVQRFLTQEQEMIRRKREMLLDHSQLKRDHEEP